MRLLTEDTPHIFKWKAQRWDVSKLCRAIAAGQVVPTALTLEKPFISAYARQVLGQALDKPPRAGEPSGLSFFVAVDALKALALPTETLDQPLLVIETEAGQGLFGLPGSVHADHVLADGQHRLTKAFFEEVPGLPAWRVSRGVARAYEL